MIEIVKTEPEHDGFPWGKAAIGVGAVGLVWWLFQHVGDAGKAGLRGGLAVLDPLHILHDDYNPTDASPRLRFTLRADGRLYAGDKSYTAGEVVQVVKSQNAVLELVVSGDVIEARYLLAVADLKAHGVVMTTLGASK